MWRFFCKFLPVLWTTVLGVLFSPITANKSPSLQRGKLNNQIEYWQPFPVVTLHSHHVAFQQKLMICQEKHTEMQQFSKQPAPLHFKHSNWMSVNYTVVIHTLLQMPTSICLHFKQHSFVLRSIPFFLLPLQLATKQSIVIMVSPPH